MEIGAHTRTHANLVDIAPSQMQVEISDCKAELEDILGESVDQFCYPFGIYDPRHPPMVKAAQYTAATTTHRGRVMPGADLFQLRRIPVVRSTYWPQFLLKLLTDYENKYLTKGLDAAV
jgi:peptidoglycan/xylan/chitin deacetylase (PgdA/CDA1 family)